MPDSGRAISNTSPLFYLHRINALHLLPALYEQIIIPTAVVAELQAGAAQGEDVPDLSAYDWINQRHAAIPDDLKLIADLGRGEAEVIALAFQFPDTPVILDDRFARRIAARYALKLTGTIGVLLKAKSAGLIPLVSPLLDEMQRAGFHLSEVVKHSALQLSGEKSIIR
ncbi:MAG: DUF3368 domain-containing protein [Chloroflexi bacterium]|nr:DUF3368 domain-containing protein [Chloroflexota bacterium]